MTAAFFAPALVVAALARPAGQPPGDSLPPGVTPAMIVAGRSYFQGEGFCRTCHGSDARGGIGPNLTDRVWLHGRGSYPEIVARVLKGVPSDSSQTGVIMPPRGGSGLTEEQVRAVAAYVWSLSRSPAR